MNEAHAGIGVDLPTESSDLHVDDVVERRRPTWLSPHLASQHFAGHQMALMTQQILEQLELADRQVEKAIAPDGAPRHKVQLKVGRLQTKDLGWTAPTEQGANAREQFRKRKWLDQIIVGAQIQSEHAVLHAVARGQDENWCLKMALSQRLQDLEPAAAWKHEVQDDQIEGLRIGPEEPVIAGRRDDDLVVLRVQGRAEHLGQFSLVLDDQDTHK